MRWARGERGMSLRGLCAKTGLSLGFLSDLEHDRRNVRKLSVLAEALGVREEDLERVSGRVPPDLKEWLTEHPKVVGHLRDLKEGRAPLGILRRLGLL